MQVNSFCSRNLPPLAGPLPQTCPATCPTISTRWWLRWPVELLQRRPLQLLPQAHWVGYLSAEGRQCMADGRKTWWSSQAATGYGKCRWWALLDKGRDHASNDHGAKARAARGHETSDTRIIGLEAAFWTDMESIEDLYYTCQNINIHISTTGPPPSQPAAPR